ncbi:hypothetical protein BDK51DRAFT_34239 [Blyttiomyces helicus]|uniref:Uncharacterized protein n=1 Tax=Blyttiomyces helicus TaxID=388810 RepID=A0A4P9W244_9FUNG|nr:hypothetical protein BDK51DRAFT_34239 [Blyttiomyces helicus]|eukprot:RKO85445.1 hypothetical protein BDK51DRAFT_34239 [Blyttiomyces helicus]
MSTRARRKPVKSTVRQPMGQAKRNTLQQGPGTGFSEFTYGGIGSANWGLLNAIQKILQREQLVHCDGANFQPTTFTVKRFEKRNHSQQRREIDAGAGLQPRKVKSKKIGQDSLETNDPLQSYTGQQDDSGGTRRAMQPQELCWREWRTRYLWGVMPDNESFQGDKTAAGDENLAPLAESDLQAWKLEMKTGRTWAK